MKYRGEDVDYDGRCPCGERSVQNGKTGHTRDRKAIIRNIEYGNLLAVCQNHLHNYLTSLSNQFLYVGLEDLDEPIRARFRDENNQK